MASTNTPYAEVVRLITDGEAVSASVTNRAAQDLSQRTQNLRESLQTLASGQSLIATNVAIQSGLAVGAPVYLAGATYTAAKASAGSGSVPSAESLVVGLVQAKTTDTSGSVAFAGRISVPDWSVITEDGLATPGAYYLSATSAGKLSRNRSSVSIYVGFLAADGTFIIQPRQPAYGDHDHTVFTLVGTPAGTVVDPAIGGTHTVNTPNPASRGWLPANATYFPGWTLGVQIPSNAKFGYNLQHASDASLLSSFPPVPADSAVAVQAGITVTPSPLFINAYGIWWLDDTYGNAPWPVDYATTTTAPTIQLWLTRASLLAGSTGVTSLSGSGSSVLPVSVVNGSGEAATTGPLLINIPALLTVTTSADNGELAIKSTTGNTQAKGPVAARIKPGANVSITATHGDSTNGYYGLLTIAAATASGYAGDGVVTTLSNAAFAFVNNSQVIQFSPGLAATASWALTVSELAAATVTLTPIIWLHGSVAEAVPASFTYRTKVVTPTIGGVDMAAAWSSPVAISGLTLTANYIYALSMASFSVPKGSSVIVQISRAGDVDSYSGQLNIARVAYTAT
jgi:hypothetical protein